MRKQGLEYLENKPRVIYWDHVAGPSLSPIQTYDVVFDEYDYKIRKLEYRDKIDTQKGSVEPLEARTEV